MSRQPLLARSDYRHFRTITTRWADNDAYGHVNNTIYYAWFDTAVNAWLVDSGLLDIAAGDPIGLVVETGCRYARSLAYPEPVEIGLGVTRIGRSSVSYRLGVFSGEAEDAAAEGHFVHVYVGRDSRLPVELPQSWRELFETIVMKSTDHG